MKKVFSIIINFLGLFANFSTDFALKIRIGVFFKEYLGVITIIEFKGDMVLAFLPFLYRNLVMARRLVQVFYFQRYTSIMQFYHFV